MLSSGLGAGPEKSIIVEGFRRLLIVKRGPGKGVAKDQMILEAFLNEFVIKPPISGEAMLFKIGACGGLIP